LRGVAFVDSAGLAALLALSREAGAAGKTLRLMVSGSPRRVLHVTGLDRMLALEEAEP
jgi:anti-anti-sigma factor